MCVFSGVLAAPAGMLVATPVAGSLVGAAALTGKNRAHSSRLAARDRRRTVFRQEFPLRVSTISVENSVHKSSRLIPKPRRCCMAMRCPVTRQGVAPYRGRGEDAAPVENSERLGFAASAGR